MPLIIRVLHLGQTSCSVVPLWRQFGGTEFVSAAFVLDAKAELRPKLQTKRSCDENLYPPPLHMDKVITAKLV